MALNIFIGKEHFSKDKHLIFDVDVAIHTLNVERNDFQRRVLREIENVIIFF